MKTVKGLHEKMGTFENANTSFHQAARCKRYTNEVLAFSMVKEEELLRATEEIQNLTYRQGEYKIFRQKLHFMTAWELQKRKWSR